MPKGTGGSNPPPSVSPVERQCEVKSITDRHNKCAKIRPWPLTCRDARFKFAVFTCLCVDQLFSTALVDVFCSSQARVEWVYHFFLRWPSVVRPGDVLTVETEIVDLRPSRSRPGYGIIRLRNVTTNQRGEIVQTMLASAMVPMRKP